jgi:hypothetical protein
LRFLPGSVQGFAEVLGVVSEQSLVNIESRGVWADVDDDDAFSSRNTERSD